MALCNKLSRLVKQSSEKASMISSLNSSLTKSFSVEATHHRRYHQETHNFLEPESYIGCWQWQVPNDPKDAERKLAQLRRDYAKKVKVFRKDYIHEIEMLRVEKQRKDEARLLSERAENEERRLLKAEAAMVRAEERKIADEEFTKLLMKERAEKLEIWRMMGEKREEKIKENEKLLHEQSSLWIEQKELERKITDAVYDTTVL